jgi:DNA-binding beta-propeller fold protein YncE
MINIEKNELPEYGNRIHQKLSKARAYELYKTAQKYVQQGEWQAGLTVVDELLLSYPDVQEIHEMRAEILDHLLAVQSNPKRDNQKYRAAGQLIRNSEWAAALKLVNELLVDNPQDENLRLLRKRLQHHASSQKQSKASRLWKIVTLAGLVILFMLVTGLFFRYIRNPAPLAGLIAPKTVKYAPHYLFSIYGSEKPMGIAISKDGDRLYVSEMGGARMIKIFDQNGSPQGTFDFPHTSPGERAPVYLATDGNNHVYVSDRLQHAVHIFSQDGEYLNTMLEPDTTLSEYVEAQTPSPLPGEKFSFNLLKNLVFYQSESGEEQSLGFSYFPEWAPLGIRIDQNGKMYLTDVTKERNTVLVVSDTGESDITSDSFNPSVAVIGASGQGDGQFLFPNAAMADSQGRIYVSDGNNGRISVWDSQGNFLYNFGRGVGEGALSLPRGIYIDEYDRLYVVDAVGQNIKTYDVSGAEPSFLYAFGDFGMGDGEFNYPNDIITDKRGRIYVVDRENNRIQVWSY